MATSRSYVYGKRTSHGRASRVVSEWTRDEMQLDSIRELDDSERQVFDRMVRMIENGRRDLSWNGPLARWLELIGRRPIRENVRVGETPRA